MSSLVRNDAHVEEALDMLIAQFSDKPKFQKLIRLLVEHIQRLEDQVFLVLEKQALAGATGYWLDILGQRYDESREGRNDTDYLEAIQARIRINKSRGEIEDIESALGTGIKIRTVGGPGTREIRLYADDGAITDIDELRAILKLVRSSGVGSIIIQKPSAPVFLLDKPFPNGLDSGKMSTALPGA